ncbi:response regulator transcription factor [Streptomyces zingiberis]|uniref:Response regulator transcription factor n=1 Tax=Streptomyces zingiberis TaxID=2053010 RepID=A0ABX1BN79_9ACTN|nr:response regulator transcription factor [Streptomyces zingiberis]NJP99188.1 response regulator transcription factor [Streptomyces zingiberis]
MRVLVVEDDPGIADLLVRGLERAGYAAGSVSGGHQALTAAPEPDVVLLDLGLPDLDGVEVCRRLRRRSDVVIIVITARGEEGDRVAALDEGADDYLVKPFGLPELLARIRAVLRRARPVGAPEELLRHGPLSVDLRTRKVAVGGREVPLTPKEFSLLETLATDPGRVVTRQEILERAWDAHWYGPTKVLDVHVAALRRKLGVPGLVETVYGRGFRLGAVTGVTGEAPGPGPGDTAPHGPPEPLPPAPLQPAPEPRDAARPEQPDAPSPPGAPGTPPPPGAPGPPPAAER